MKQTYEYAPCTIIRHPDGCILMDIIPDRIDDIGPDYDVVVAYGAVSQDNRYLVYITPKRAYVRYVNNRLETV